MAEEANLEHNLFEYKGFNLITNIHPVPHLDQLENFKIQDSDVFAVTYPKSGTSWIQHVLSVIYCSENMEEADSRPTIDRVPWIEYPSDKFSFDSIPPPRLFASHLPFYLIPKELKRKGKVIYLARNPKDVIVSYYHFHIFVNILEDPESFDQFLEKFLDGRVFCSSWFDHINGWYKHKDEFDFLFMTYEEMHKDLRSAVIKISNFVGKELDNETIEAVVERCTFKSMKSNPMANYENLPSHVADPEKGTFLRKGIVGDWKNHFTIAQNEKFDELYHEKMKDFPLNLIWK
ncbi:amine sulfotransferase-like isoform X3 [Latimeria chalumnae]|uniref:Sulfotransferase n=1 Tax=Latimeria chalumnae TaxID=7897 RepID=M3XGI2_LATCH